MRRLNELFRTGLYRGNDLSGGGIGAASRGETPLSPRTPVNLEFQSEQNDKLSKEREQELESWMEEVKAFIRQIDVTKL